MREPDSVAALITTVLVLVVGLVVINAMRGDTERVTTGAVLVLVLSLAHMVLRSQRDR